MTTCFMGRLAEQWRVQMPSLLFNAACHAADVARYCSAADALTGRDDLQAKVRENLAAIELVRLADDLGFVVMAKADHIALTAFVEEVRDFRPTLYRDYRQDPQDREDDMMPFAELEAFQVDAEDLIGPKARAAA
jgi:hypothetical protein